MSLKSILAVPAALVGAGLAAYILGFWPFNQAQTLTRPLPGPAGGQEAVFAAGLFEDGRARRFELQTDDGVKIRYFVLKSRDGVIRAAIDACEVCWPAGKGYTQRGRYMICNNCGRPFADVQVGEIQGGCNPHPLKSELRGDRVVIRAADIVKEGRRFFDLGGRARGRG